MDITYNKIKNGVYNFEVNFSEEEMLGYDEITSEVKCALIEFSTELDTHDFEFEYESHHGPIPQTKSDPNGNEITVHRVNKVEFFYTKKGDSKITLNFNYSLKTGRFNFNKIELKYPEELSKGFLDNIANQINIIVEHLLSQQGKLCVNCVWCHNKKISGFCDYEYKFYKNKST